jgi:hypothetical protein
MHSLFRAARERIARGELASRATELLEFLEEMAQEVRAEDGGAGFAIFRSPDYSGRYDLPNRPLPKVVIADHFYLMPFVADAFLVQDFFVLVLSKKHLRLFRYVNWECQELPLPARVPPSLDVAGGFDQPDHDLANRSYAGPSNGTMQGVHFGTQSDREALPEYLHHFFGSVDRELYPTLGGKPLLLMGVHEDVSAYQRAARYPYVFASGCLGSTESLTLPDITARAAEACRAHYALGARRALAEYLEISDRSRTLADIPAVLRAAREGRVHRLCVRSGSEIAGPDGQDLVNAAVVETLRTDGEVFMMAPDTMPTAHPLAAVLRY